MRKPPRFDCDESGVQSAAATAGGPHTFNCAGPTTVTLSSTIPVFSVGAILDGGGALTLGGGDAAQVLSVGAGSVELRALVITAGSSLGAPGGCIAVAVGASLTLANVTVSGTQATSQASPRRRSTSGRSATTVARHNGSPCSRRPPRSMRASAARRPTAISAASRALRAAPVTPALSRQRSLCPCLAQPACPHSWPRSSGCSHSRAARDSRRRRCSRTTRCD